jgi:hypothetical protein
MFEWDKNKVKQMFLCFMYSCYLKNQDSKPFLFTEYYTHEYRVLNKIFSEKNKGTEDFILTRSMN